jgi:hypothetical protein
MGTKGFPFKHIVRSVLVDAIPHHSLEAITMTIRNTDAFILSCFAEDVRAIPGIHQRTIHAAQTLVTVATRYRDRLINAGHSPDVALSLLNDVVNAIHSTQEA